MSDTTNNIVIRKVVQVTDPTYFCNKSWTISFNLNTRSWTSFHSYIPNWYIGENNFFYSGLNGCCNDLEAIAVNELPATTTSTTTYCWTCRPIPTTSYTTTSALECELRGEVYKTSCDLSGSAIITVPPATTTTICQRPSDMTAISFIAGYTITGDPVTISYGSFEDACDAMSFLSSLTSGEYPDAFTNTTIDYFTGSTYFLNVGSTVYYDSESTDCTLMPDGWYFTSEGLESTQYVYHVEGGIITEILTCYCGTTSTTTTVLNIPECCGVMIGGAYSQYFFDVSTGSFIAGPFPGQIVAMTANKLWRFSSPSSYDEYNLTLSPFSVGFVGTYPWPTASLSAVCAKSDLELLVVDNSSSPENVCSLVPSSSSITTLFPLQTDRTAIGNLLYTTDGKLLVINQDTISGDYYLTQYSDLIGTIELEINLGADEVTVMFECNCNIYIVKYVDGVTKIYQISELYPYSQLLILEAGEKLIYAAQPSTCVLDSLNITTTTTTTTIAP